MVNGEGFKVTGAMDLTEAIRRRLQTNEAALRRQESQQPPADPATVSHRNSPVANSPLHAEPIGTVAEGMQQVVVMNPSLDGQPQEVDVTTSAAAAALRASSVFCPHPKTPTGSSQPTTILGRLEWGSVLQKKGDFNISGSN